MNKKHTMPLDAIEMTLNRELTESEKSVPDASTLYYDLKDKFIDLKMRFVIQRRENVRLRKENGKLLIRALEAERMLNEKMFPDVKQSPADEMIQRETTIYNFLNQPCTQY